MACARLAGIYNTVVIEVQESHEIGGRGAHGRIYDRIAGGPYLQPGISPILLGVKNKIYRMGRIDGSAGIILNGYPQGRQLLGNVSGYLIT